MRKLQSLMIGIWPILMGILLMGNSFQQKSPAQFLSGSLLLIGGIILTCYFSNEKKFTNILNQIISRD